MIYVTDYMLARHAEVLQVYERSGKDEIARRERMRLDRLKAMRDRQEGKTPTQQTLF